MSYSLQTEHVRVTRHPSTLSLTVHTGDNVVTNGIDRIARFSSSICTITVVFSVSSTVSDPTTVCVEETPSPSSISSLSRFSLKNLGKKKKYFPSLTVGLASHVFLKTVSSQSMVTNSTWLIPLERTNKVLHPRNLLLYDWESDFTGSIHCADKEVFLSHCDHLCHHGICNEGHVFSCLDTSEVP